VVPEEAGAFLGGQKFAVILSDSAHTVRPTETRSGNMYEVCLWEVSLSLGWGVRRTRHYNRRDFYTWFPEACISREVFSWVAEIPWQVSDPLSISCSAWPTMWLIFIMALLFSPHCLTTPVHLPLQFMSLTKVPNCAQSVSLLNQITLYGSLRSMQYHHDQVGFTTTK
jgi:hypothetical protein